jgi:hypothetical protein
VTLEPPHRVHSSVTDSRLFDHLESTWELRPGPRPNTTWLTFKVDFAFSSALYRQVADLFFSEVVKRMMGAFEGRCAQLYGASALAGGGARRGAAADDPDCNAVQQHHHRRLLQRRQQQRVQAAEHLEQRQQEQEQHQGAGSQQQPRALENGK